MKDIEQKVKPSLDKLAEAFEEFKLPKEVMDAFKLGIPLVGSLKFTKMMMFANEIQLNNNDIDYFMNLKPQRQEDESYEDMKIRGKLTKALYKYRPYLYDYSVFNKN